MKFLDVQSDNSYALRLEQNEVLTFRDCVNAMIDSEAGRMTREEIETFVNRLFDALVSADTEVQLAVEAA